MFIVIAFIFTQYNVSIFSKKKINVFDIFLLGMTTYGIFDITNDIINKNLLYKN